VVIERTDRVSTVIGRDESLIDVFVAISPAFERLRNAGMRRVMARLVTVEQAARMAGVDANELVARLNAHDANAMKEIRTMETATNDTAQRPAELTAIRPEHIVVLDVREELRAGREPFSLIMAARREVPEGGALSVRAIFEPVPLYAVMAKQGMTHWTERLADDDWRVWFYPAQPAAQAQPAAPAQAVSPAASTDAEGDVVVLDVRGLEPPEPMARTLAALDRLPPGATLVQINVRVPQFLLPMLEERGFTHDVREQEPGLVRVFIRRRDP
jgi:uncharacterized protein (DUF2249 family)